MSDPTPAPAAPLDPEFVRRVRVCTGAISREQFLQDRLALWRFVRERENAVWLEAVAHVESLKGADAVHEAALLRVAHSLRRELEYKLNGRDV